MVPAADQPGSGAAVSLRTSTGRWPGDGWQGPPGGGLLGGGPLGGLLLGGGPGPPALYPTPAAARRAALTEARRLGAGHRVRHVGGEQPGYVVETTLTAAGPYRYRRAGRPAHGPPDQELEAMLDRLLPPPLLRVFREPLHGAAAQAHARLMAQLAARGVDPKQAGYTYQSLVAQDLGDITAQGILNAGRTPWDVGNRHEVTLEGRGPAGFGARKLAQLGGLLQGSGTLNLTLPQLSPTARRQLGGLLRGLHRPGQRYGLIVRQTLPGR